MSENSNTPKNQPSDLADLEARLLKAKGEQPQPKEAHKTGNAIGMAWRISIELVVAVLVGGGLGYGIDHLAGTRPWFMLAGLIFGFAAGIKNTLRLADKMNRDITDLGEDLPEDQFEDEDY